MTDPDQSRAADLAQIDAVLTEMYTMISGPARARGTNPPTHNPRGAA